MYSSLHQATIVCIEGFYVCQTLFELLSWYHHLPPTQPVNSSDRQSKNIIHNRNFIPAPLYSQSAPLMNTCWPVLRTCNSNTFVLFFLSFLYSKKEFLQPKNHSSSNHVFKKIFSSSEKEKKSANYTLFLHHQTKQNRNVFSVQILRHFYKAPCEIKSVRC